MVFVVQVRQHCVPQVFPCQAMRFVVLSSSLDAVGDSLNRRPILYFVPEPFKHELRILDVPSFDASEGVPNPAHELNDRFIVQSVELYVEQVEDGCTSSSAPVTSPADGDHRNEHSSFCIDVCRLALLVVIEEVKPEF